MQGLLVGADEIHSTYSYEYCSLMVFNFDGLPSQCAIYQIQTVIVAPLVPPFSYNNLCSSVLLTRFIPVYILVHSFQIMLPFIQVWVFMMTRYSSFPKYIQPVLNGVFWPHHWSRKPHSSVSAGIVCEMSDPHHLLKANRIISSDILNHLLVFCTFGMCSPFLALIMVVSVSLKHRMWVMLIGRFVHSRVVGSTSAKSDIDTNANAGTGADVVSDSSERIDVGDDNALVALSAACVPILDIVSGCVWPVVFSSGLFFSFLCWDVLGDDIGWKEALWAPALILGLCACMWGVVYFGVRKQQDCDVPLALFGNNSQLMESNPLHGVQEGPQRETEMRGSIIPGEQNFL